MGVALVTGASGLVGSHVVRALLRRGDDVRVTVRDGSADGALAGLGIESVRADVLDRRALRRAMVGVERVFHCAGSTSLRAPARALYDVHVTGTRNVLGEALAAGVQRAVHVSSVAAIGPAQRGSTADERFRDCPTRHGLPYATAKHQAEVEARRVHAAGLPVVVVCPAHVLGRDDLHRSSTEIVRRFLRREIPAYVDGALNVVGAEDVAQGILLADELGRPGERYILGGRNFTLDRLFADLGRLSGVEPPAVKLPLPVALAMARTFQAMPGRPPFTEVEIRASSLWWAYRSTKARRELGWRTGHHEEPLVQAIEWVRERERVAAPGARQPVGLRVAGFGVHAVGGTLRRLVPR
jgi:dihydroflavonol-4-reductase